MEVGRTSLLQRVGCGCAGWGCALPCALLAVLALPLDVAIVTGLPFVTYLLVRLIAVAWVRASMIRTAGGVLDARTAAAASGERRPERPLRFREYSSASDLALDPGRAALLREGVESGRESWRSFRRASVVVLLALFAAAVAWTASLYIGMPGELGIIWLLWAFATIQVGVFFLVTRTTYSVLQRIPADFLVFYLLIAGLGMAWLFAAGGWGSVGYLAAFALGVLLLFRGYRRLHFRLRGRVNRALLILRVFGADANTAFTFGEIARRWRFLGSIATIADASYIRFHGSLASRANRRYLGVSVAAFLVWVVSTAVLSNFLLEPWTTVQLSAVSDVFGWAGRFDLAGLLTSAILGGALLMLIRVKIRKNFSGTLARLRPAAGSGQSASSDPVRWDGVFQEAALYCHDDVWKVAVASLLPTSHAVLMDLRGFSADRKGCEYELGLLIDAFPIDRVLLVTDRGADLSPLFALLEDRWSRMSPDSPNQVLEEPVLSVYAQGVEDPDDIQRILLLLASRLPAVPAQPGTPLSLPAVEVPRKPRLEWAERFGRLDLRISQPFVAIGLALAFLALLLFKAYQLAQPVREAYEVFAAAPKSRPVTTLAEAGAPAGAPVSGPRQPFVASGRVWTNTPVLQLNLGRISEDLDVCIRFEGGPVGPAPGDTRITRVEHLAVRAPGGKAIRTDFVKPKLEAVTRERQALRDWPKEGATERSQGRPGFCVTAFPEVLDGRVAEVRGRVWFDSLSARQRLVVKGLDSLLPDRGRLRLTHPMLEEVGRLELVRFSADDGIQIRFQGDLDRFDLHVRLPDDTTTLVEVRRRSTGYLRKGLRVDDLAAAVLEIRVGAPHREAVDFVVSDLPVPIPERSTRDRFLDRFRNLESQKTAP